MTREEAIANLKRAKCVPYKKETLAMATEALRADTIFFYEDDRGYMVIDLSAKRDKFYGHAIRLYYGKGEDE